MQSAKDWTLAGWWLAVLSVVNLLIRPYELTTRQALCRNLYIYPLRTRKRKWKVNFYHS
jgi:hypothetical protein